MPKIFYFLFLLFVPLKIWSDVARQVLRPSLNDYPAGKSTVGVLLYKICDKSVYVLLAQESLGSHSKDAGTFSDFGGGTNPKETFYANAQREIYEESCGLINMYGDVGIGAKVFYLKKKNPDTPLASGRDVFYIVMPTWRDFSPVQFMKKREELISNRDDPAKRAFLEKDRFEWIKLDDLLKYDIYLEDGFIVQNISGHSIRIVLRRYFWDDCLSNPEVRRYFKKIMLNFDAETELL